MTNLPISQGNNNQSTAAPDPLEEVLGLEESFYRRGYQQGLADGVQAGRADGRAFGMKTGYEKFFESGRLASRAVVWANRLPQDQPSSCIMPKLAESPRLAKNISTLYALVEPSTLSTKNADEDVQDFDDRMKRAEGKARVVEKMVSVRGGRETPPP